MDIKIVILLLDKTRTLWSFISVYPCMNPPETPKNSNGCKGRSNREESGHSLRDDKGDEKLY